MVVLSKLDLFDSLVILKDCLTELEFQDFDNTEKFQEINSLCYYCLNRVFLVQVIGIQNGFVVPKNTRHMIVVKIRVVKYKPRKLWDETMSIYYDLKLTSRVIVNY